MYKHISLNLMCAEKQLILIGLLVKFSLGEGGLTRDPRGFFVGPGLGLSELASTIATPRSIGAWDSICERRSYNKNDFPGRRLQKL